SAFGGTMRRVVTPEAARFKRRYATRKFSHIFRGLKPTAMVGPGRTSLRESQCTRGDLCRKVWRNARATLQPLI
ncbi:MAG: hypothetical protein ACREH8_04570, partial [Opitutaceae bacterium]